MDKPLMLMNQSMLKGRIETARLTIWTLVAVGLDQKAGACAFERVLQARSHATSMRKLATSAT